MQGGILNLRTLHPYEVFLYIFIVIWSLSPSRLTPVFTLFDIKISTADALIILLFIILFPLVSIRYTTMRTGISVAWVFSFIILWAFITLMWLENIEFPLRYYVYPLIISYIIMLNGYLFSKLCAIVPIEDLLVRMCSVLTLIFVIYGMESLFGIGLRSNEGIYISDSFAFDRLKGPLAGPTVINTLMLPILSFFLGNLFRDRKNIVYYMTGTIIIVLCILLTGSRAAIIGILMLVLLFFLFSVTSKNRLKFTILSIFLFSSMLPFILSNGRLTNFQDLARQENLYTGWLIMTDTTTNLFFGKGYGSVWTWYYTEMELLTGGLGYADVIMKSTDWGRVLNHPHSVFLALAVEMGLLSVLAFIIMLGLICSRIFNRTQSTGKYLLYGVISTFPLLFFDLYLIKNWKPSMIWWIFVFMALSKPYLMNDNKGRTDND